MTERGVSPPQAVSADETLFPLLPAVLLPHPNLIADYSLSSLLALRYFKFQLSIRQNPLQRLFGLSGRCLKLLSCRLLSLLGEILSCRLLPLGGDSARTYLTTRLTRRGRIR